MYLDSLEFLDEERDAWHPFEALQGLTDEQLSVQQPGARGWSGRDLMAHMLARQEIALQVARELAVSETSATMAAAGSLPPHADDGNDPAADESLDAWRQLPMDELRARFRAIPGELRGHLTVVPESRWLKHPEHLRFFLAETTDHYEAHRVDLAAVLRGAG